MERHVREVSLEEWSAVSDELGSLVRAGIPLAPALASAGADIPGRLGDLVGRIGARLERGESLADALAAEPGRFPPVLAAVVQAGLRANRLPVALEQLAEAARRLSEMRQTFCTALIYPLFLLAVAYGLFITFLGTTLPRLRDFHAAFRLPEHWAVEALTRLGQTVHYWGSAAPIVVLAVLALVFLARRSPLRAALSSGPFAWRWRGPAISRNARLAVFAELLGLLLEQQASLPESLRLAARSTADGRLVRSADLLASGIERGADPRRLFDESCELPPFLRCLLLSQPATGHARAFQQAARLYRDRVAWQVERWRWALPIGLVVLIGGGATALLAVVTLGPFLGLLKELTLP